MCSDQTNPLLKPPSRVLYFLSQELGWTLQSVSAPLTSSYWLRYDNPEFLWGPPFLLCYQASLNRRKRLGFLCGSVLPVAVQW